MLLSIFSVCYRYTLPGPGSFMFSTLAFELRWPGSILGGRHKLFWVNLPSKLLRHKTTYLITTYWVAYFHRIQEENVKYGDGIKLMGSDRPQAKFRFKSDSNCLLIDFFDPISAVWFTRRDNLIQIRTVNRLQNLIYIKKNRNRSNWIKFFNINWLFDINWLFGLFNWL